MSKKWFSNRQGIEYKVIGLVEETETHESYLVQNKPYGKTQIIHVLRNGNGRRYKAKPLNLERIEKLLNPTKRKGTVVLPWATDENAINRENGLETNRDTDV